ncbi:AAA family ATPase [Emticicia agri]|uniref:ATPase AAA-type core domain-containing protein n=1 Tax=Emticicia agri TaxID=2492393 RepID=A0A4Q5LYE0_9BACT|nr:AAA family ATPase [Emticicia agri]RYU94665.1 hypothetical protein EWM59_16165 [Emticicia agri]
MDKEGVYLKEVEITDVKCFKNTHKISFTNPNGEAYQWNIILGNNNTGKTTILKILASLEPKLEYTYFDEVDVNVGGNIVSREVKSYQPSATIRKEVEKSYSISSILSNSLDWHFSKTRIKLDSGGFINPIIFQSVDETESNFNSLDNSFFIGYGTSRKMSETNISNNILTTNNSQGIFNDKVEYINAEEWLIQLDYSQKNAVTEAKAIFSKIKNIIITGLLPDVKDIELISEINKKTNSIQNYVLFHTDYGKVRLKDLGYGYQSTLTWVVDLAKKMFEKYPELENPLTGSAIVLIDEIDLHLHPDWQRKLIGYLSNIFPNVQFIATAHSPLIIQSADDINLIILEKDKDNTHIRQEFGTFQGWTVEEILQNLMGLGEKTVSDKYLELLKQFEEGMDEENYEKANSAFEILDKILHSTSSQRKLLKLQLGSIAPAYT